VATAPALAAYAAGLPAFVAVKVLQPGFFARENTRIPMVYGAVSMVVNVAAAFGLFFLVGHVGIAAATSIAAWVNAGLLYRSLAARGDLRTDAVLKRRLLLLTLGSVLMGVGLFAAGWLLGPYMSDPHLGVQVASLAALVAFGLLLFTLFCHFTGAVEFRRILSAVLRRT
jgi:putative peptidoglycan lipid II flippase